MQLLILCAPVWFKSSRFSQICAPPGLLRQPLRVIDGRRAADVVRELVVELGDERRVVAVARVLLAQLVERAYQRLGDEHAAVRAEVAARVGKVVTGDQSSALRTSSMNARIRAGSLMPLIGVPSAPIASTPLDTSTAHGRTRRIAAPTFAALSPPDSTSGRGRFAGQRLPVERLPGAAGQSARRRRVEQQPAGVGIAGRVF